MADRPPPPAPITVQATAAAPRGAHRPARRRFTDVLVPLMLVPMAGIGIAIWLRSFAQGQWPGVAFATFWLALVLTLLVRKLRAGLIALADGRRVGK